MKYSGVFQFFNGGVPNEMLERAGRYFQDRLQIRVRQEGHHLNDIIFRTLQYVDFNNTIKVGTVTDIGSRNYNFL